MSRILVGVVGAPHGVKGELRVKSFTGRPAAIADYGPLWAEGRHNPLVLGAVRPVKDDMVVVRFDGVASRDAAAALTGTRLFVDRSALPKADEEEYYHVDLIGLRAEAEDGTSLGHVRGIVNYGGGDLVEIAGVGPETRLVAFTRAFVPRVDIPAGRLIVAAEALIADTAEENEILADPGSGSGTR